MGANKLDELTPAPLGTSIAELKQNRPPDDADAVTADYYEQLPLSIGARPISNDDSGL